MLSNAQKLEEGGSAKRSSGQGERGTMEGKHVKGLVQVSLGPEGEKNK